MKSMNKFAVSLMISYVLLISIVLVLSIGVYSYLKIISKASEEVTCKDDTSIILRGQDCFTDLENANLRLDLKNNGRFNINGVIVIVKNESDIPIYLLPNEVGGTVEGHHFFSRPLHPGESLKVDFTNIILNTCTDLADWSTCGRLSGNITQIEIQPFIIQNKDKVICDKAVVRIPIKDECEIYAP